MTAENEHYQLTFSTERLSQDDVKYFLDYDPETGIFRWKNPLSRRVKAGDIVGSDNGDGYLRTRVRGISYRMHQLAWLYIYGEWSLVDHINKIRCDNRIANLRKTTRQLNVGNQDVRYTNLLGVKGVQQRGKRFRAYITKNYYTYHLGTFDTIEEASAAYQKAAKEHFGEFANG